MTPLLRPTPLGLRRAVYCFPLVAQDGIISSANRYLRLCLSLSLSLSLSLCICQVCRSHPRAPGALRSGQVLGSPRRL